MKKLFLKRVLNEKNYWCVNLRTFHYQQQLSPILVRLTIEILLVLKMPITFFHHVVDFDMDAN